jgi:hypothetical protein
MNTLTKVLLLSFIAIISSCDFKENYELPSWDVGASAPIASSSVGFSDLLSDTTLSIDTLDDSSLIFVYQQDLVDYSFDDIVGSNSMSINRSANLGDVDVDDVSFTVSFPFGDIVSQIGVSNGTTFPNVINPFENDQTVDVNDTISHDASGDFERITFNDGVLELTLTNNFDIDLSNVKIKVFSKSLDSQAEFLLNQFEFIALASGASEMLSVNLNGKTMSKDVRVQMISVGIPSQNPAFTVNYDDKLIADVFIKEIGLENAKLILSNQELINDDTTFTFNFDGALMKRVRISNGEINMNISSTLESVLNLKYSIPGATLDGQEFYVEREIPAMGSINETISLVGYEFDLTGANANASNSLYVDFKAYIDSTGIPVEISSNDGVNSVISINNVTPNVAWGYLGQDTVSESRETSFIDLSTLNGELDFEFVEVKMVTENFLGASADLHILNIESFSDNGSIVLESSTLSEPFTIAKAVESQDINNPVLPTTTEIIFDESNSNIDEIVESKPNKIAFDFEMVLNGDNPNQEDGFIYLNYGVNSRLEIEIPVSMKATNMSLKDTVDVSLSVPTFIENGSFTIVVNNGFPFDADIKMQLMNNAGLVLQELTSENIVQASEVDVNGRTINNTNSTLNFPFEDLSNILNRTKKIGLEITLNTQPTGQFVKLYSDYTIDMTIIGNFEKLISETIVE